MPLPFKNPNYVKVNAASAPMRMHTAHCSWLKMEHAFLNVFALEARDCLGAWIHIVAGQANMSSDKPPTRPYSLESVRWSEEHALVPSLWSCTSLTLARTRTTSLAQSHTARGEEAVDEEDDSQPR